MESVGWKTFNKTDGFSSKESPNQKIPPNSKFIS